MSTNWRRSALLVASGIVAAACSGEDGAAAADTAASAGDTGALGRLTDTADDNGADEPDCANCPPDVVDTHDGSPSEVPDTATAPLCPGSAGCPCKKNEECDVALCLDTPAGAVCATKCVGGCQEGFTCAPYSGGGGDISNVCVPKWGRLCDPCAASKECDSLGIKDFGCIDHGAAGAYCSVGCTGEGSCQAGFTCTDRVTLEGAKMKACTPIALDPKVADIGACTCSAAATAKQLATACFVVGKDDTGKVLGKCLGQRTCLASGLSACSVPATSAESCDGKDNDCDGQTDEAACDDGNPCTQDACDPSRPAATACAHKPTDGQPCNADNSVCTDSDACAAGLCVAGKTKGCDDKNPCTADACDAAKGCTQTNDDGVPCSDNNPCTVGDVCAGGSCDAGAFKSCDSGKQCVVGECSLKDGECTYTDKKDGLPCDDETACTTGDACKGGACDGTVLACDDVNPCTLDSCDAKAGCANVASTGACDDGNACTAGDVCKDNGAELDEYLEHAPRRSAKPEQVHQQDEVSGR